MLSDKLKTLRIKRGLTQAELAKKAKVHPITLSKWENGRTHGIKLKSVIALAAALNVTPTIFLGVNERIKPNAPDASADGRRD